MLRRFLLIALLTLPALGRADGLFVVELFTSQGCSSCPPADEMFGRYAEQDDVIALSFHVDYWDYLGWSDTLAHQDFSARQKGYAMAAGHSMVYTPQFIINGVHHVRGYQPAEIETLYHSEFQTPVELVFDPTSETEFTIRATAGDARNMEILLVHYVPRIEVMVERGENAGRTIVYRNSVTRMVDLGRWSGQSDLSLQVDIADAQGAILLVQRVGHGPIQAAVRLR